MSSVYNVETLLKVIGAFIALISALTGLVGAYIAYRQIVSKNVQSQAEKTASGTPAAIPRQLSFVPRMVDTETGFVGREGSIRQLESYMAYSRTVAITAIEGMGGIGKTALAQEVATRMLADGKVERVLAIDLRGFDENNPPLTSPEMLRQLLRQADTSLAISALPPDLEELKLLWLKVVSGMSWLIVFDNARNYDFASLLPSSSPPFIIITSRNAFNVPTIILGLLDEQASTRLAFETGNRRVPGTLSLADAKKLADVCGHHPLLVKSTAAAVALGQIKISRLLERGKAIEIFQDTSTRMTAHLTISIEVLSIEEKQLFSLLSVFASGFSEEWVNNVCGIPNSPLILANLYNAHVIEEVGEGMFRLHDLYKAISFRRLSNESALLQKALMRHARFFSDYVLTLNERYRRGGEEISKALTDLDRSMPDILSAQTWALENWKTSREAAVCASKIANQPVLSLRIQMSRRIDWLFVACEASRSINDVDLEAESLSNLGDFLERADRPDEALEHLHQAQALNSEHGRLDWLSRNLGCLGSAYRQKGEYTISENLIRQAIKIQEDLGLVDFAANQYGNLALTAEAKQEPEAALPFYGVAIDLSVRAGHKLFEANHRLNRAFLLAIKLGDGRRALQDASRSLELYHELGKREDVVRVEKFVEGLETNDASLTTHIATPRGGP